MTHTRPADPLDTTFAALADATRRAILARLALGEASVNELAAPFRLSQPTISKHLKVLERAGLISQERSAQRRLRRLVAKPLEHATEWLNGYRNAGTLQLTTPTDREITFRRVFGASRRRVFDAFTQPDLLRRWFFGAPGGSLAVCEVALKAGDSFRYVWRSPSGSEIGMSGRCLEFVRPAKIVATEKFDQPWYPGEAVGVITLDEEGGVTTLTQTIRYESQTARDTVLKASVEHGVALGYDRLAKLLESLSPRKAKK
jgi:uncharacterized protein YndB with AHSA1/START domain/DNA-binding transcriptional ArsR family regulator